jgi:hypothetical protein
MAKTVVSENVSLDGVIQDPAGDEAFRLAAWVGQNQGPLSSQLARGRRGAGAEALLRRRRSDEWFTARWPSRSGHLADRINSLPKYAVDGDVAYLTCDRVRDT